LWPVDFRFAVMRVAAWSVRLPGPGRTGRGRADLSLITVRSEAPRPRGDQGIGNASTLAQHPEVQARLKEIKGAVAARTIVTTETLINEAEEARVAAMRSGQNSAACTAVKVKSVLSGKWIERAEVGAPGEYEALSDEELERQIMERVARLGLTDVLTLHIPHMDNAADVDNNG
jgi:hypothetical protein